MANKQLREQIDARLKKATDDNAPLEDWLKIAALAIKLEEIEAKSKPKQTEEQGYGRGFDKDMTKPKNGKGARDHG